MTAGDLVPEPGSRDARPLESAVGRLGGANTRRAVFVSLLVMAISLPALIPRLDAERDHPGAEVAVESAAVTTWARETPDVLAQLKDRGVRTVIVDLQRTRDVIHTGQLAQVRPPTMAQLHVAQRLPAKGSGVWLQSPLNDPSGAWSAMVTMLRSRTSVVRGERVKAERIREGKSWRGVLRWDTTAAWREVPVGYDLHRIGELTSAGVRVVPAVGVVHARPGWLAEVVRRAQQQAATNRYLLLGGAPLENSAADKRLAALLSRGRTQMLVGDALTEDQRRGVAVYESSAPGRVVRVHWVDFGSAVSADALVSSGRQATKERGVRMLAVRVTSSLPPLPASLHVLQEWQQDLPTSPTGPQPATARVADPLPSVGQGYFHRGSGLLACFMVVALAIYLLTETRVYLRGRRWRVLARPLAALAYCALALLALVAWLTRIQSMTDLLILLAACTGAWAAIATAAAGLGRPPSPGRYGPALAWVGSILRFGAAALVVLAAGTAVAAAGAQPAYLLAVEGFVDHRLLLVVPVAAVAVSALALLRVDLSAGRQRIDDARLRWGLFAGVTVLVVGFAAWYLVYASGSDSTAAAGLLGPDRLGEWLYVRPRFVGLFVGYPALLLALRWPGPIGRYLLLVVAAVGPAGTVDTFAHFDLPYWTAVLSSGYTMAGGLVVGLVAALLVPLVLPSLARRLSDRRVPGAESASGKHALRGGGTMES